MHLIECLERAKLAGYCILEMNDYSRAAKPMFATFETVSHLINTSEKFKELAVLEWHYKNGSGAISVDHNIRFYLWSGFPNTAPQHGFD